MSAVSPAQLLYMATNRDKVSVDALEWLRTKIISHFWDNPVLLVEAVKTWHACGGAYEAGMYLTESQFNDCCSNLKDTLNCGDLIVHLASTSVMNLKRVPCPAQPLESVLNVEQLIQRHASTVSFDKTSDAFLHAILRLRLEPRRLATCAKTEMPYEKISAQLTKDANEELGPIIDEPITQRVDRIKWANEHIDPELAMLAIHILVEMLQIPTPPVFHSNPSMCVLGAYGGFRC